MLRIAVLLSGRGSNLEAIIRAKESGSLAVEIAGVVSDREAAGGVEIARKKGIPVIVVARRKGEQSLSDFFTALTQSVSRLNVDLVVLAGFMRIIPPEMLRAFEGRMINIHPSLLPAFRGLNAQKQALDAGVKFSGCTVHFVVPEVDAGMTIAQAVVPIMSDDTEEALSARILVEEHKLLPAVIAAIAEKRLDVTESRVIVRGELRLDSALRSLELK